MPERRITVRCKKDEQKICIFDLTAIREESSIHTSTLLVLTQLDAFKLRMLLDQAITHGHNGEFEPEEGSS